MKPYHTLLAILTLSFAASSALSRIGIAADEPPAKPIPVITPGKVIKLLKQGGAVRIAPAGEDRKPTSTPVSAKVNTIGKNGRQTQVTLDLTAGGDAFHPVSLVRLWVD